jgi:hypothetical protein
MRNEENAIRRHVIMSTGNDTMVIGPQGDVDETRVIPTVSTEDHNSLHHEDHEEGDHLRKNMVRFMLISVIAFIIAFMFTSIATTSRSNDNGGQSAMSEQATDKYVGATDATKTTPSIATISLDGLVGQKWSNAKKIITSRGGDVNDARITVLTDDGKDPVVDSNWTVTSVKRNDDKVTVNLKHDSSDASGVVGQLTTKGKDALGNLTDGSLGLGKN